MLDDQPPVEITVYENGPVIVRGAYKLQDRDRREIDPDGRPSRSAGAAYPPSSRSATATTRCGWRHAALSEPFPRPTPGGTTTS